MRTFHLEVFPIDLYVATVKEKDFVQENYLLVTDKNEFVRIDDDCFDAEMREALTIPVVDKRGNFGCLILILRPETIEDYVLVHESSHFGDWCNDFLGLENNDFYSGETKAYLIEWAFKKLQLCVNLYNANRDE